MFIITCFVFLLVSAALLPVTAHVYEPFGRFLELAWRLLWTSVYMLSPSSPLGVRLMSVSYILLVFALCRLFLQTCGVLGVGMVFTLYAARTISAQAPTPGAYRIPEERRKRPRMAKPTRLPGGADGDGVSERAAERALA